MKVFRPWAFQGSKRMKNYFEGWYFKHVSEDRKNVYAIIPGLSLSEKDSHSFVQLLDGLSGETLYFRFPVSSFNASGRNLSVKVGKSSFDSRGIKLDIDDEQGNIRGEIDYGEFNYYPAKLTRPGIMGWYSFVPFMECKHGIVSTGHAIDGQLEVRQKTIDFSKGRGYIEKDWGSSFPESWIWLHCNTFKSPDASFTFSVAKIPWLGSFFIGFISYLSFGEHFYNFSTWSKAKIESLQYRDNILNFILANNKYKLYVKAVNNMPGDLKAPVLGSMTRIIKETVDARIEIRLIDRSGNTLFEDEGIRGGMELIDSMLDYF
ncbi:MAG: tocopherol cyclase family protein [Bacteroidales bacterium]|nr:tocopherol cyclase family protein [Bacteroidales bacterium]